MKPIISTILFLILNINLFSQQYMDHIVKAMDFSKENKYKESIEEFKTAFNLQEGSWRSYYYAACTASLANENEQCIVWVEKAIEKGFCDLESLENFNALISVRKHEKWITLVEKTKMKILHEKNELNKQSEKSQTPIRLRKSDLIVLEKIMKKDDPHLLELKNLLKIKDSLNAKELTEKLENFPWVQETHSGIINNEILFSELMNADLILKEKYLPSLQKAVEEDVVSPQYLANLTDKILLEKGEKQIYGTQIGFNSNLNSFYVKPLDDVINVDKRRSEMELPSMDKYLNNWKIIWNSEKYISETENLIKYERKLNSKDITYHYELYSIEQNKSVSFPGCENVLFEKDLFKCTEAGIRKFVSNRFNTEIPAEIGLDSGIFKIFLYFTIDKTGFVKDVQAYGVHPKLELEAKRVAGLLPQMTPATLNGVNTGKLYTLPIIFAVE